MTRLRSTNVADRTPSASRLFVAISLWAALIGPLAGCRSFFWPAATIPAEHRAYYHEKVAEVDALAAAAPFTAPPQVYGIPPEPSDRLPEDRLSDESWPMTLFSAVRLALEHNRVIRQDSQFLSVNNPLFNSIDANASMYDPFIQDTNITFGNRGLGAAMGDFAPNLSSALQWGRDDQFNNVAGFDQDFSESTRQFALRLEKQLAFGGTLGLNHSINFSDTTNPSTALASSYSGPLSVDFEMPLWAAAGTEFTQIAGPAAFLVPRVTSVNQGVLISQISSEIARVELEESVRGLVRDVVNLYWDLHLAYVRVETEQLAADDAETVYDRALAQFRSGRSRAAEEAQSAETYYAAQARLEDALRSYDETERRFRRLLGLAVADGRRIKPIDEPTLVAVPNLWHQMLTDALHRRPQIRKSKHNLRSLQLQLKAARSLNRPRLDFSSSYAVNGFGEKLVGGGGTGPNFYERIGNGSLTGWTAGLQFSMPLGFPQQRAQVNNLELRVAKSRTQLAIAEQEIAHELGVRLTNAKRWTRIVNANDKRRDAATRLVKALKADFDYQRGDIDQLVRAQATLAQAEVEYRRALVEFRKALAELDFSRSALLEANAIEMHFPKIAVASEVRHAHRPVWIDLLPAGRHLAPRLPSHDVTVDPAIRPAATGGAYGHSAEVGEVSTREPGAPLQIDEPTNAADDDDDLRDESSGNSAATAPRPAGDTIAEPMTPFVLELTPQTVDIAELSAAESSFAPWPSSGNTEARDERNAIDEEPLIPAAGFGGAPLFEMGHLPIDEDIAPLESGLEGVEFEIIESIGIVPNLTEILPADAWSPSSTDAIPPLRRDGGTEATEVKREAPLLAPVINPFELQATSDDNTKRRAGSSADGEGWR